MRHAAGDATPGPVQRHAATALILVVAFLAFVGGCAPRHAPDTADAPRVSAAPLNALGAPSPQVAAAWAALDAECAGCHVRHAHEHATSAHARAFTHPVFQAEFERAPTAACVRCHAPLAFADAPATAAERGVGCVVCHAPHDARHVGAGTGRALDVAPPRADCATCHDFPVEWLPARGAYAPGQRLQRTVAEHRESPESAAGTTCVDCHARQVPPSAAGERLHTQHAWPGARNASMLEASITLLATAARGVGAVDVVVTLSSRAGHAVPTGDVFRALAVHAVDAERPTERDGTPRDAFALLERRFEMSPLGLREVDDTRVPADGTPRVLHLQLPHDCRRVHVTVEWQALRPSAARAQGLSDDDVRRVVRETHVVVVDPRDRTTGAL